MTDPMPLGQMYFMCGFVAAVNVVLKRDNNAKGLNDEDALKSFEEFELFKKERNDLLESGVVWQRIKKGPGI